MSTGVNVLRYTALPVGALYGFSHQRTLNAAGREATAHQEYAHREALINKAKSEYERRNGGAAAAQTTQAQQSVVISDPEDPKFDLEAWIKSTAGEGAKS